LDVIERLGEIGIVPVVEIPDAALAVPLADALLAAGIACAEITFRTAAAADAIAAIRDARPDMLVGAGTVLTVEQAKLARDSGARFLVSPGYGRAVVGHALEVGLPILPGVCTPTEVLVALEAGLTTLKFFPAEAAGGEPYLRALGGPFRDVRFVPTGGIDAVNLAAYLALPQVLACGGSWFVRKEWLARGDFAAVTEAAAAAGAIVAAARSGAIRPVPATRTGVGYTAGPPGRNEARSSREAPTGSRRPTPGAGA
jgi:2-dehydro-3-deoxyphosphogluconate aldolase/(4S)-4-hydroxy-2-oxoglutarate aldolase